MDDFPEPFLPAMMVRPGPGCSGTVTDSPIPRNPATVIDLRKAPIGGGASSTEAATWASVCPNSADRVVKGLIALQRAQNDQSDFVGQC